MLKGLNASKNPNFNHNLQFFVQCSVFTAGKIFAQKGVTVDYFRILYPLSCFSPEGNLIKDNKGKKRSIRPNPFVLWSKDFIQFLLESGNKDHTHLVLICSLCFSFRCGSNVITSRVLDLLCSIK